MAQLKNRFIKKEEIFVIIMLVKSFAQVQIEILTNLVNGSTQNL